VKRTWKFRVLPAEAAAVMGSSRSFAEAGRRLGLHKSSVSRLVKAGKLPPCGRRRSAATTAAPAGLTAQAWRARIRRTYELDVNESVLVDAAAEARAISQDATVRHETRLAAIGRFAALLRQLNFEGVNHDAIEETETPPIPGPWPRVAG
jgi:hypothetical protein